MIQEKVIFLMIAFTICGICQEYWSVQVGKENLLVVLNHRYPKDGLNHNLASLY